MVDFSKIPGSLKFGVRVERSLRRNFARAVAFFGGEGAEEVSREELACRRMVLSLVRTVMESDGPMTERKADAFRRLLADEFSPVKIERVIAEMRQSPLVTADEAAPLFREYSEEERERLIRSLLILAASNDSLPESAGLIEELGRKLGFSGKEMA